MKPDVIINHFDLARRDDRIASSCRLSASLYRSHPDIGSVSIIDGSPTRSESLADWARFNDIRYLHKGRALTFAEGYNSGLQQSCSSWVILSASDIYPKHHDLTTLIETAVSFENIGVVVPYLTDSAFWLQGPLTPRLRTIRSLPAMTLNLNLFRRDAVDKIGGVPEQFSGNYNDLLMSILLRKSSFKIVAAPCMVTHLGRMTVSQGSSSNQTSDHAAFFGGRAQYMCPLALTWHYRMSSEMDSWLWRRIMAMAESGDGKLHTIVAKYCLLNDSSRVALKPARRVPQFSQ